MSVADLRVLSGGAPVPGGRSQRRVRWGAHHAVPRSAAALTGNFGTPGVRVPYASRFTCANDFRFIPRISRDQRPTAALADLRLHTTERCHGAMMPRYDWSESLSAR